MAAVNNRLALPFAYACSAPSGDSLSNARFCIICETTSSPVRVAIPLGTAEPTAPVRAPTVRPTTPSSPVIAFSVSSPSIAPVSATAPVVASPAARPAVFVANSAFVGAPRPT